MMKQHEEGEANDQDIDDGGRNGRIVRNPHFVSAFFVRRLDTYVTSVINKEGHLKDHWIIGPLVCSLYCSVCSPSRE